MPDTPKKSIEARRNESPKTGWATRDEVAAHWAVAPRTIRAWNRLPQSDPKHLPYTKRFGRVRIAWAVVRAYEANVLHTPTPKPLAPRKTVSQRSAQSQTTRKNARILSTSDGAQQNSPAHAAEENL